MHGTRTAPPRQNWRLSKTLARRLEFRPVEREDMRYAYAAYKKGCLASMGDKWEGGEMDAAEFAKAFEVELTTVYHGAWSMLAESRKGFIPVGMVLAFYSHPDSRFSPFMIVGDMVWFPWATGRNKIESAVNFFNSIRSDIPMVEYASQKHRRFFEMICRHGVMRRIGTMDYAIPGGKTAVFETRAR